MAKPKVDWYELYTAYWDTFGRNREQTLQAFGLFNGHTSVSDCWRKNKQRHIKEYEQARADYFESCGATIDDLILRLNEISCNGTYEKNRLEATCRLLDYLTNRRTTEQLEAPTKKLVMEIIDMSKDGDSNENQ